MKHDLSFTIFCYVPKNFTGERYYLSVIFSHYPFSDLQIRHRISLQKTILSKYTISDCDQMNYRSSDLTQKRSRRFFYFQWTTKTTTNSLNWCFLGRFLIEHKFSLFFIVPKFFNNQGICSSRLAIALKAAGQCLTRKGERYLYGCKQSEINQIY